MMDSGGDVIYRAVWQNGVSHSVARALVARKKQAGLERARPVPASRIRVIAYYGIHCW